MRHFLYSYIWTDLNFRTIWGQSYGCTVLVGNKY